MPYTNQQAQRNTEQPHPEASRDMLLQLLHQHVGGAFVVSTPQVAALLGKSEAALRIAEARHRSKYGCDLLPKPLIQNAEGRVWSIAQVAQWLAQGGLGGQTDASALGHGEKPVTRPARLPGRPRKAVVMGSGDRS